jgi:hypothetical protein
MTTGEQDLHRRDQHEGLAEALVCAALISRAGAP